MPDERTAATLAEIVRLLRSVPWFSADVGRLFKEAIRLGILDGPEDLQLKLTSQVMRAEDSAAMSGLALMAAGYFSRQYNVPIPKDAGPDRGPNGELQIHFTPEERRNGTNRGERWATICQLLARAVEERVAARGMSTGRPPPPPADGPCPPDRFYFRGEHEDLAPIPFRLIDFMWNKRTVPVDDLISAVWGENVDVTDQALKAAKRRVNEAFRALEAPYELRLKAGHLVFDGRDQFQKGAATDPI